MNRRDVLRLTTLATGAAISSPLHSIILAGCKPEELDISANGNYHFFSQNEFSFLSDLTNTILPKTDSPSAAEVGVPEIIDAIVGLVYDEENKKDYGEGFSSLMEYLDNSSGDTDFAELETSRKVEILRKLDVSNDKNLEKIRRAFLDLKQQTIAFYLTTEEVSKNFLNYLPNPGDYEPCIPLSEVGGKAWAL